MIIVTSLEILAFIWSIGLFFAAIFIDDRRQEAGLSYSAVGLIAFVLYYSDVLPFLSTTPRHVFELVGASAVDLDHPSSAWVAIVIAALFILRMIVYYELLIPKSDLEQQGSVASFRTSDISTESALAQANDLVAPALSYATSAAVVGALIALVLGLNTLWGFVLFVALLLGYYGTFLYRRIWTTARAAAKAIQYAASVAWDNVQKVYLKLIILIAKGELARGRVAADDGRVYSWANERIEKLNRLSIARRKSFEDSIRDIFTQ